MTLTCKHCNHELRSLIVIQEAALNELAQKLGKHLIYKHPELTKETATQLARLSTILPWLLSMQHVTWSYEETFIETEFSKWNAEFFKAMGVILTEKSSGSVTP
jgi:hypothetical protein